MDDGADSREVYIRRVLEAYRLTPGTTGLIRQADRRLASDLFDKGVRLDAVENAFVLATARRLLRPPEYIALATVRSLHYFLPVIEEVAGLAVGPDYFQYLRGKIRRFLDTSRGA